MSTLMWTCPECGHSRETEGRDESSRSSIRAFKREHETLHAVVVA